MMKSKINNKLNYNKMSKYLFYYPKKLKIID